MTTASDRKIRVLIVEDSATVRRLLENIVEGDPRLTVAGAAASGEAALSILERVNPDIITMDIRLPGIDGLETTKRIMKRHPTPIIVVALVSSAEQARVSIDALKSGALSVVERPRGVSSVEFDELASRLRRQLVLMSEVRLVRHRRPDWPAQRPPTRPAPLITAFGALEVVGIVASTGGPNAFLEILRGLGRDFPAPILAVQHITPSFTEGFASWLDAEIPMRVEVARHGETPKPGFAYIAPGDAHLEFVNGRLAVSRTALVSSQRPSGDVLFRSIARNVGARSVAVLLTGMGDDGAEGMREAYDSGAHTIAEDESTAVVYGMPAAAAAIGAVTESLPLHQIAPRLCQLAASRAKAAS